MASLDSFFTNIFPQPSPDVAGQDVGFNGSNLDLLLQQARRNQAVRSNRIFDYLQVENDPYFSRNAEANSKILSKYTSELSVVTHINTVVKSMLSIGGLMPFVPPNIRSMLLNFNALADTNILAAQNIKQIVSFQVIEKAFLSDLTFQFGNQTITFNDIALMEDRVFKANNRLATIENSGIRSLLSVGIQQFLPTDMQAIFTDAAYLDMMADIFGEQSPTIELVNQLFREDTAAFQSQKIQDIVNPTQYTDVNITLADPLGIALQSQFQNEFTTNTTTAIIAMVESSPYFDTQADKDTVIDFLVADATTNISEGLHGGVGLPSLTDVVNGVVAESNNNAFDAIVSGFETFTKTLLADVGISQPEEGTNAIDHLQNVKRNLELRLKMSQEGATSDKFTEINNYLKNVLINKDLTETRLKALNTYLDTTLGTD